MADITQGGSGFSIKFHDNGDGTYSPYYYDLNGGSGGGGGLSVTDEATFTAGTSQFVPTGGVYNDSVTALTSGQQGTLRLTANRSLHTTTDNGALETGGNLATIATNTGNSATSANQTNGNMKTQLYDPSSAVSANVVAGDTGFNGVATASATKTYTFTTSASGAQTILANTPCEGFSWVEVVYTSVGAGLALTGQFSTASGGTYVSSTTFGSPGAIPNSPLGTTVNTLYFSSIHGNYFQIAVTALTSGTFTGTVTVRTVPPPFDTVKAVLGTGGSTIGNIGSSASTGSSVPANAFYIAGTNGSGNLTGIGEYNPESDGLAQSIAALSVYGATGAYNGGSIDRVRNNITAALIAAGTTTTQSNQTLTTYNARHATFLLSITAGTGSVTLTINGSSSSSYTYTILTSTALTSGVTALLVGPDMTAATNTVAQYPLPRVFSITATVSGTITYGLDYILSV